jgi:hypothetical protein
MKSYYRTIIRILLGLFILTGCEKQVLDKKPLNAFSEEDVFSDLNLTKMYVNSLYNSLPMYCFWRGTNSIDDFPAMSDEAYTLHGDHTYLQGELSPDQTGIFGSVWSKYSEIKDLNIFFEKIEGVEGDEDEINRLIGEVKVIRAWVYFILTDCFGGVPLITKTFGLSDDFEVPRSNYQECIDFVLSELEAAKDMLPMEVSADEFGRLTKPTVLALKSRILLYAASKLHDPAAHSFGVFFNYNQTNKWQKASDAAKAVIDLNLFSLVEVDTWQEYHDMFLSNNSEVIFAVPRHVMYGENIEEELIPNGYVGWSGLNPTQEFVDNFQMSDGLPISESPLYNPSPGTFYLNKEMRFYSTIMYNGLQWQGRDVQFYIPNGRDSKQGPQPHDASLSGYTLRKFLNESTDFRNERSESPAIQFRLAEIYLNYAEAEYYLGHENVAREYINKVRTRVKLPAITSSGAELLEDLRYERKMELCFENGHRWSDIRRWMIAGVELNKDCDGIQWKYVDASGNLDPFGTLDYELIPVIDRVFLPDRMYYAPIPRSEMNKTDLVQNPGYPD